MKLYGLIGYPLSHSFSKKYFAEKFIKEQIEDCTYELFPISSIDEFPLLLNAHPDLKGLNVTIPYKEQVLQYVTAQTDEVKKIGAANTIKINGRKLSAYNTDVIGFERSFVKNLKSYQKKALILGSGGASKAVQYVLNKLEIEFLLVSRESKNTNTINYSAIDEGVINNYKIIINCTPAGMYPKENECPQLPYEFISSQHYLFDLIYRPEKTLFLQKGEEKGATIKNGYEMLVIQAEESWKIWNEN